MITDTDMAGHTCFKCGEGMYIETGVMDDNNGVLHCSVCRDMIYRYIYSDEYKSKSESMQDYHKP